MSEMDQIAAQMNRESALFVERTQTGEARDAFAVFAAWRKARLRKSDERLTCGPRGAKDQSGARAPRVQGKSQQ